MTEAVEILARDPLRNIVLLKHLKAYPGDTQVHHLSDDTGTATLVLLSVAASAYDRRTYPSAALAALVSSDHAGLTRRLLGHVPRDLGIVFKLSSDADCEVVADRFPVTQTARFLSFTARASSQPDRGVRLTYEPNDDMYRHFAGQGHDRGWFEPLLRAERAFACALEQDGETRSVCFAFEAYRQVWEIGGVMTPPAFRGRGYAARVVRTALAELEARDKTPRYQVDEHNIGSIRLAQSVGLERFLTITHLVRAPGGAGG